ncbi:MAG: IclR family transcriptional regulator [Paracoccaceae bacterium]
MSENQKYRAPALDKGLDILELLASSEQSLSQKDMAAALDRSSSEIYRMLSTLVQRGYIMRSATDELYSLSLKMFSLSQKHPPIARLLSHALPLMQKLAQRSWQSCHICIEDHGDIVVVASVPAPGNWGMSLRTGSVIGLSNSGSGRVLAAFRDSESVDKLFEMHRLATGEPQIDKSSFLARLPGIRKLGYEIAQSDTTQGVTNLSFPVFDPFDTAIIAVTCPYMKRLDTVKVPNVDQVAQMHHNLATELTAFYGGSDINKDAST